MQPQREVRLAASKDHELRTDRLEDHSPASELPAALRRELIEKLRKADRPVLASIPPYGP